MYLLFSFFTVQKKPGKENLLLLNELNFFPVNKQTECKTKETEKTNQNGIFTSFFKPLSW